MQPIERFSVIPPEDEQAHGIICLDGVPVPFISEGRLLEAQWQHPRGFLLMLSDDSPYDDALYIYLVNSDLSLLDTLVLAQPYTPGLLRELTLVNSETLEFIFFEGVGTWRLRIFPKPRFGLFNGPMRPAKRPLGLWFGPTYLSLILIK